MKVRNGITISELYGYPNLVFSNPDLVPFDSLFQGRLIVQDSVIYRTDHEQKVLYGFDGEYYEVLRYAGYGLDYHSTNLKGFSDYENIFFFLANDDSWSDHYQLYALNKVDTSFRIIEENVTNLVRYGQWTYYTKDDALYKIGEEQNPEHILNANFRYRFETYKLSESMIIVQDSSAYAIDVDGNLISSFEGDKSFLDFTNSAAIYKETSNFLIGTNFSYVHFDGQNFTEYLSSYGFIWKAGENLVQFLDGLFVLDSKEIIPYQTEFAHRSIYIRFSFLDKEYLLLTTQDYGILSYEIGEGFALNLLDQHYEATPYGSRVSVSKFSKECFVIIAGKIFTIGADEKLTRLEGLGSESSKVAIDGKDVYFLVYPNPSSDVIHFEPDGDKKMLSVELVDNAGKLVRKDVGESRQLNMQNLSSGLYILKVNYSDRTHDIEKIIVD